jgi:hydroxymethylbilane synthase
MSTAVSGLGALRLGTRRSLLARTQAQQVADALTARTGREVELVEIVTTGDTTPGPIAALGGTGVFVNALRDALLDGRVDLAVHSLKDLPTTPAPGLVLAAVPPREDARDALVARDGLALAELPDGARIGTGSPRRAAMLRALGLGVDVVAVRGNVDTRLALVADGELDGVLLARAGLARLGRLDAVTEVFDPVQVLPAPGQGALAVESLDPTTLDGDAAAAATAVLDSLQLLDDPDSRASVAAERALLATLEAGCTAPVGAYAVVSEGDEDPELYLRAAVVAVDGTAQVRQSTTGAVHDAQEIGRRLATEMLAAGAAGLLGERVP